MRDPLSCIVENALRFVGRHPRPAWNSGRVVEGAALEMLLGGLPLREFESLLFRLPWFANAVISSGAFHLQNQFGLTTTRHPFTFRKSGL